MSGTQQYINGTRTAVNRPGTAKSQYLMPVAQPGVHSRLEYRAAAARAEPLAVHDANAALPPGAAFANKQQQLLFGFCSGQAMQINMSLNCQFAAAEFAHATERDAGTAVAEFFTRFDIGAIRRQLQ